jgi:hypothetical protein
MWWVVLISLFGGLFSESAEETQSLQLDAGAGPVIVQYISAEATRLSVIAQSDEGDLDLTLEILADGTRLAFNDDHTTEDSALSPQDAAILNLPIPAGNYQIRVHTFSGAQTGPVTLRLIQTPLLPVCVTDEALSLAAHNAYSCTLRLEADTPMTLSAFDLSGTLDPVLWVYDADGALVAFNDDHNSHALHLNTLDPLVSFTPPLTGEYELWISDFTGASGTFELRLTP